MNIQNELSLSFYKDIAILNEEHRVALVQHIQTKQIFLKKTMDVYNLNVYTYLKENPIPGIPKIYELIKQERSLIVIEDYISGQSLEKILASEGSLTEERVIKYTLQICETLSRLHASSPPIIHRDIKPTNIIITPTDNAILIDLNAAKHESSKDEDTTLLGTRGYAAPEQYGFGSSGVQTDIYAIGKLMNTMLNGSFSQQTVNGRLNTIINKCTELTPSNRFKSITDLANVLRRFGSAEKNQFLPIEKRKLLPPGFRSGSYANMCVASAYYLFIAWLSFDMKIKDTPFALALIQQIFIFLILLSIPFSTFNYADIHNRFPLCSSENRAKRILGIILLNLVVIISLLLILLIIFSIISR
ncbi:MAG: protein kinase [Lachnospiraceae bacterium]|nr:protein kinase [Lachnospiraceae bacterium]